MDVVRDQLATGRKNRVLTVVDTFSRFSPVVNHHQFETHLADFVATSNFGRRLKTLRTLTPYEFICKCWTCEPERFIIDPIRRISGLNT